MKKLNKNLVPDIPNPTPDYYCTWQTQLYATCDGKPAGQRAVIGETGMFAKEKPYGWAYFYENARRDLLFIMDDSWDVPLKDDPSYYGSLLLNEEKFPESCRDASPAEALKRLTERMKALGWKGLGGWVCAQESERFCNGRSPEAYWKEQLTAAHKAGFAYWKVDWGKKDTDLHFRRMLTELGRTCAPDLIIEHAKCPDAVPYGDAYRTYDVPAIMSIPMTLQKIREFAGCPAPKEGNMGLLNCEDEAYIAAAGGFSMGIMRHPYRGAFTNGKADVSFPEFHRDLKSKMAEVVRAARWHRIAPAFGMDGSKMTVDSRDLTDCWQFKNKEIELEDWWFRKPFIIDCIREDTLTKTAPARIARNCPLAEVEADAGGDVPYVVCARNPNGAFSIVTLGRTADRTYFLPRCKVTAESGDAAVIGIFGCYESLCLKTGFSAVKKVLMQDLAGDAAYDVTDRVSFENGILTVPGALIQSIGTSAQEEEDTSEPGVVLSLEF